MGEGADDDFDHDNDFDDVPAMDANNVCFSHRCVHDNRYSSLKHTHFSLLSLSLSNTRCFKSENSLPLKHTV